MQLVEKNMTWLNMASGLIPSLLYNLIKPRKSQQKKFKPEGSRPLGATIIDEEEQAMIRQRGGERMEDVSVEAYIPFQVTKEGVKLSPHYLDSWSCQDNR
jgi:hypothetical protein